MVLELVKGFLSYHDRFQLYQDLVIMRSIYMIRQVLLSSDLVHRLVMESLEKTPQKVLDPEVTSIRPS